MSIGLLTRRVPPMEVDRADELLARPAEHRGFWTDDELITASGISSIPLLRKVQSARWLIADYVPRARGGRMRVWTLREVLLAAILVEFSKRTGIAVLPAAHLLYRARPVWVEEAAGLDRRIEALAEGKDIPTIPERRLVVIDMKEAWAEQEDRSFQCVSREMVLGSGPMTIPVLRTEQRASDADLDAKGSAHLSVVLSRLRLKPLEALRERL